MQKVAGKEGLWRLEPHEKLLGVRCKVLRDAMPTLADGTVFSGAFGVVGGRVMRPKPKSGGMYLVHLEGDSPSDRAMRIVAYLGQVRARVRLRRTAGRAAGAHARHGDRPIQRRGPGRSENRRIRVRA